MTPSLLIDNSAWSRLDHAALPLSRRGEIDGLLIGAEVAVCLPFLLETGYSAQRSRDHSLLLERLLAMPRVGLDSFIEDLALNVQAQLAETAQHRVSPVDLLIAVLADHHSLGLLHYDAHFDHIKEHSELSYDSVWLAPAGSL